MHWQRQAALTPPLAALIRRHKVKRPHDRRDGLHGNQRRHSLAEAEPRAAVEDGELGGGFGEYCGWGGGGGEPAFGAEGVGVVGVVVVVVVGGRRRWPGRASAVHSPWRPDDDGVLREMCPVWEGGAGGGLDLFYLEGDGWM